MRIFESIHPAGDERPVRGSFTNRLVGVGQLQARTAWLLEFSMEEAAEEEEEETVEYRGGNSFVSFCPPTQRRATITVVAHRALGPGNHRFL